MMKLYRVLGSVDVVAVGDGVQEAKEQVMQAIRRRDLGLDFEVRPVTDDSQLPPEWNDTGIPYGDKTGMTIREWLDKAVEHRMVLKANQNQLRAIKKALAELGIEWGE